MKILSPFRGNPFSDPRIREFRLRNYTVAHVAHLAADPRFSDLAEDTAVVHAACYGASAEAATRDAVAQSRRARMEATRKEFLSLMSQHEGTVRGIWGRSSEPYLRFYPSGASEYHNASLQTIDEKLARYETAALEFAAELPPSFIKAFLAEPGGENGPGGVIPRFRAARAAQLTALGAKTQGKLAVGSERKALENRLYQNVLLVASRLIDAGPEELAAAERLFPVHRLFKRKRAANQPALAGGDGSDLDARDDDDEVDLINRDEAPPLARTDSPSVEPGISAAPATGGPGLPG